MSGFIEVLTQDILVTSILMGLIALVGLIGNALMLRALVVYPQLRTDFYIVFGCLSVVDSLFLLISVPAHIMEMVLATDITTDFWCKGSMYMISSCGFMSANLIVVLAVLRGILLTNRNIIRRPTACHLLIVCIAFSIVTMLCSAPIMFMFTSYHGFCDLINIDHEQSRHTWLISSFSAFVPLVLVMLIYFMTYMLGKRYFSDSYSPREKEKSWLVTYIIIAFTVCQIPYRVVAIYDLGTDSTNHTMLLKMYTIKNYLMCLVMADKAVRPILYTKLASDLSEAFDEVINCTYCAKHYSMGSRFRRTTTAVYSTPATTCNAVTAGNGSIEDNLTPSADRNMSTFSATSQTPLTHKDDDIEISIDI